MLSKGDMLSYLSYLMFCATWVNMNTNLGNCLFSHAVYRVLKTTLFWLACYTFNTH